MRKIGFDLRELDDAGPAPLGTNHVGPCLSRVEHETVQARSTKKVHHRGTEDTEDGVPLWSEAASRFLAFSANGVKGLVT
jgi:hypothetical protein